MNLDRFESAARSAFSFLERDHGMTFVPDTAQERHAHFWVRYLTYRSAGRSFVQIELDDRDRAFNVLFGPLEGRELPPYPIFMERDDEPVLWFPLWAVLSADGAEPPPFSFAEDARLDADLAAWAAALQTHARRALAGDFADLEELVRRVKREARWG